MAYKLPKIPRGMRRNRKTGRPKRLDVKRSLLMKRVARKRKGRPMKASTKMKFLLSMKQTKRTHRTKSGRRAGI